LRQGITKKPEKTWEIQRAGEALTVAAARDNSDQAHDTWRALPTASFIVHPRDDTLIAKESPLSDCAPKREHLR
jgi:hypothetical protein